MAGGSTTTHIYTLYKTPRAWETLCGLKGEIAELWHKLDEPIRALYADQPEAAGAACGACRAELARRALEKC